MHFSKSKWVGKLRDVTPDRPPRSLENPSEPLSASTVWGKKPYHKLLNSIFWGGLFVYWLWRMTIHMRKQIWASALKKDKLCFKKQLSWASMEGSALLTLVDQSGQASNLRKIKDFNSSIKVVAKFCPSMQEVGDMTWTRCRHGELYDTAWHRAHWQTKHCHKMMQII